MRGWRFLCAVPMKVVAAGVLLGGDLMGAPVPASVASSTGATASAPAAPTRALREIADPGADIRWRLVRDPTHPAGPGRLVPISVSEDDARGPSGARPAARGGEEPLAPLARVILAGDRIVVEESTPIASVRLAAVALVPARAGDLFLARLEVGGRAVRVIALGSGHGRLAAVNEVRP
jgi:hypothetical protein